MNHELACPFEKIDISFITNDILKILSEQGIISNELRALIYIIVLDILTSEITIKRKLSEKYFLKSETFKNPVLIACKAARDVIKKKFDNEAMYEFDTNLIVPLNSILYGVTYPLKVIPIGWKESQEPVSKPLVEFIYKYHIGDVGNKSSLENMQGHLKTIRISESLGKLFNADTTGFYLLESIEKDFREGLHNIAIIPAGYDRNHVTLGSQIGTVLYRSLFYPIALDILNQNKF